MTVLEVEHVTRQYGGKGRSQPIVALDDVSLSLSRGQILAVLGLNGAGKTTLVKIICGLLEPHKGRVSFPSAPGVHQLRRGRRIGAVFEGNRNIYWRLTAHENLEYFGVLRGLSGRRARQRSLEMLELFNLVEKKSVVAGQLSRGMQQRLALAISMVHDPEILVLDEPTLGVDIENVEQIVAHLTALSASGVSIVLTSHQMDFVRMLAHTIAMLSDGRLVALDSAASFASREPSASYSMKLLEDVDCERFERLKGLGVASRDGGLHFATDRLYEVLEIVKPLRIGQLDSAGPDLVAAFISRVKEVNHA